MVAFRRAVGTQCRDRRSAMASRSTAATFEWGATWPPVWPPSHPHLQACCCNLFELLWHFQPLSPLHLQPALQRNSAMHVASALQLRALPCGRLTARSSNNETRRPKRAAMLPRAQQQGGATADAPAAASVSAAVEQQAVPLVAAAADTAAQMEQQFEEVYVAAAESAAPGSGGGGAPEQVAAVAVAPPPPAGGRPRLPIDLSHPAVRVAGISAAVFLGGTLLITLWRMARDPEKKRSKTINKNKVP